MAVPHQAQIRDPTYLNWVRAGLGLKYTKEGIESFIDTEARVFHSFLINQLGQPPQNCGHCTSDNLLPHHQSSCQRKLNCICSKGPRNTRRFCPISVCGTLFDAIVSKHRFKGPSWKNSDISKWVTDHWEVAKNFLPNTGGYKDIKSARDTDLSGLVNIGINMEIIANRHNLAVSSFDGPDDFIKCRTARNEILHHPRQSLTDDELAVYLSDMKVLLQCTTALLNDAATQQAMNKLTQLGTSAFVITDESISEVRQMVSLAIQDEGSKQMEAIKEVGERHKEAIDAAVENQIKKIQQAATSLIDDRYQEKKNKLKHHLIETYMAQILPATLPEVDRLYERPKLKLLPDYTELEDIENAFSKEGTPFSRIYISGDAGHGKTSLCKMLVLAWCQEHSEQVNNPYIPGDFLAAMKKFDFLFYISLRNTRNDWIISKIIKKHYFMDKDFLNLFIQNESHKNSCLVILDGLDEWTPPCNYETPMHSTHGLPDLRHFGKFTILTTTRIWKLEELRLGSSEMDRQILLAGFDFRASERYIDNLIHLLNKKTNISSDSQKFRLHLNKKQLSHFRNIPILLKYLLIVWHDDEKELTRSSLVHLYSAMINHLLKDTWERNFRKPLPGSQVPELPSCFSLKQYCEIHKSLLFSLARLAFTSTCKGHLIFDHVEAEYYGLKEDDIKSCLIAGLLCQEKFASSKDDEKKQLSFLHKSFQDFFTAVFLVIYPDSAQKLQTCMKREILDVPSLFIFVCGMDSRVMAGLLKNSNKNDRIKQELVCEYMEVVMESEQQLIQWDQEYVEISNSLYYLENLQYVIQANLSSIKYVDMHDTQHPSTDFLICLELLSKCRSLRVLKLKSIDKKMEALLEKALCVNWSLSSLYLSMSLCEPFFRYLYSDKVNTLELLQISFITIPSHAEYQRLMDGLAKAKQLKQLEFSFINYSESIHIETDSHHLDLSYLSQLQELILYGQYVTKVTVNATALVNCKVYKMQVNFVQCQHIVSTIKTLHLKMIKDHNSLVEIVTLLPHLTQLLDLELQDITGEEEKCSHHIDLSNCSQLQTLIIKYCDVTKVTINTTSITYCEVDKISVYFVPHRHVEVKMRTLILGNIRDPHSLDEIVTLLPHLALLSDLHLRCLDFGDRNVSISQKSSCLETIKLINVLMSISAMKRFLKPSHDTCYSVVLEFSNNISYTQKHLFLDRIASTLPLLLWVTHLNILDVNFGDRDLCLSHEAIHLEKVELRNVIMTDRAMIQFLDSFLTIDHKVACEISGRIEAAVETHVRSRFLVVWRYGEFLRFFNQTDKKHEKTNKLFLDDFFH